LLSDLTVFILTSSPEERDRQRAEQLGAKAYLLKPPTAKMLLEVLEQSGDCAVPAPTQASSTSTS
jgi:CheY-like chemotaxis protein